MTCHFPRFTIRLLMLATAFVAIIYGIGSYGDRHRRPVSGPIPGTLTGIFPPYGVFEVDREEFSLPVPVALGSVIVGAMLPPGVVRRRRTRRHRLLRPSKKIGRDA